MLTELPPGIDKFTVRALCSQHCDFHYFNFFEDENIALCQYASLRDSREAHRLLNHCVLHGRQIKAEMPCEGEVKIILHHLRHYRPVEKQ